MKTKMTLCLMSLLLFLCGGAMAQEKGEGIRFTEGKTFAEALKAAKAEGRMLFVDCYTSWCGPCRMMSNDVFTQKTVGDYFNSNFVSLKIDMEKGEGPELRPRWNVRAYPTFLFFDGDGQEITRLVGSCSAEEFLQRVQEGTGAKSLSALRKRYADGERDVDFMLGYLDVLEGAYASDESKAVADELLKGRETELLDNEKLYNAFLQYNGSPMTPAFTYVLDHKADFETHYDKEKLDAVMERAWMSYPSTLLTKNGDGTVSFDEAAMKEYVKLMKSRKVEKCNEIVLNTDILRAESQKDWARMAKLCSKHIKKYGENDMLIYNWCLRIQKEATDRKVRDTAIGWMERRIENIKKEEAAQPPLPEGAIRAMPMVNFSEHYLKLIEGLKK